MRCQVFFLSLSKVFLGDWTLDGVSKALDEVLSDDEIDIVLAMGVASSFLVSQRSDLPKPVIAPFVLDAEMQGIPFNNGVSGVKLPAYKTGHLLK